MSWAMPSGGMSHQGRAWPARPSRNGGRLRRPWPPARRAEAPRARPPAPGAREQRRGTGAAQAGSDGPAAQGRDDEGPDGEVQDAAHRRPDDGRHEPQRWPGRSLRPANRALARPHRSQLVGACPIQPSLSGFIHGATVAAAGLGQARLQARRMPHPARTSTFGCHRRPPGHRRTPARDATASGTRAGGRAPCRFGTGGSL